MHRLDRLARPRHHQLDAARGRDLDQPLGRLVPRVQPEVEGPPLRPTRAAWLTAAGDKRTSQRHTAHLWKVFRNNAIELFVALGGQEERDFLAAQLAATRDRAMKKRIEQAIATLDKRLARTP